MKSILYIVAIVAILAGGWFSYDSMDKFQQLKTTRLALDDDNTGRDEAIKATKKQAKDMEALLRKAKSRLTDAEEGLKLSKSNLALSKKQAAAWKSKIAGQDEKLDEVKRVIKEIKEAFKDLGQNIQLDQIPALVSKLEGDLKDANKKLDELQALADASDSRVAANTATITELDDRISKRAARIKGNSAEGRVTAVNHDWGFVTLEIPTNMPIGAEAKLMIKRGMSYIGNLNVNAIEGRRVIADIDYQSMTPGMVVQPGDHVILAKPVTN